MLEWHNVPQVNYWKSSNGNSCNMVSGKDPGDLPMNIHRGDNFTAFIGQLCRKVTFNYLKEVSLSSCAEKHIIMLNIDVWSYLKSL